MTDLSLKSISALVGVSGGAAMLLGLLILRLTLTRRLKHKLQSTQAYWDSGTIDFGFINTALFAWACTLPYMQRSERFRLIYGDLNVKAFATRLEVFVAYVVVGGLSIFFLVGPCFYFLND